MARNKIAPAKNFHKTNDDWKRNKRNVDRANSRSDPFFVSQKESKTDSKNISDSFFVSKQESSEILEKKNEIRKQNNRNLRNRENKSEGFFKNKSEDVSNFKGNKINKNIDKKPFDKRKWRLQKYSKRYKLEQWEEKRRKAVLREYYKEIKDDKPKLDVQKIYEQYDDEMETNNKNERPAIDKIEKQNVTQSEETNDNQSTSKSTFKGKPKSIAYKKAQSEFNRLKNEKLAKKEEILKKKGEKEKALQEYNKKKNEKYKKLNQKTRKGQPIMKGRIEMLLEKIQSS